MMWQSFDDNLGDRLIGLAKKSTESATLIAPFITRGAFDEIIGQLQTSVKLKVITRWNVVDIAAGVSDPRIWESSRNRPDTKVFLSPSLHAKYFRFDSEILVGSANITGQALGLRSRSNIELLTTLHDIGAGLSFESQLVKQSVEVDDDLYEATLRLVPESTTFPLHQSPAFTTNTVAESWLPQLRHPEALWDTYTGTSESLTRTTISHASEDLAMWDIPQNLDKQEFHAQISVNLLHMPMIVSIDRLLKDPQRFGSVRDHIASEFRSLGVNREADECWQTTIRWLRYFLPDRYTYSVANYSEIMVRN